MPDLQAVPTAVWWLLAAGLVLLLLDPHLLVLAGKLMTWLRGLVPQPGPQPSPTPVGDPIAMYKGLKAHCADCPPDVLAAFRVIWLHLDDPHGNLVPRATPPKGGYNQ